MLMMSDSGSVAAAAAEWVLPRNGSPDESFIEYTLPNTGRLPVWAWAVPTTAGTTVASAAAAAGAALSVRQPGRQQQTVEICLSRSTFCAVVAK